MNKMDYKSRTYITWQAMMNRCYDPRTNRYSNYGGRGIKVCERWQTFQGFLADMGERPEGMEIDRMDNDGDYGPQNCRWVTRTENARNKRNTVHVVFRGAKMRLDEVAGLIGLSPVSIYARWRLLKDKTRDLSELYWRKPYPKFTKTTLEAARTSSLTLKEIAEKYGVSPTYTRLLRNGYRPSPQYDV